MSVIHLIVFLVQFILLVPALFWFFKKAPKGSKNKKLLFIIATASIFYASIDSYFHRFLIASDMYYVLGDLKKSEDIADIGLQYLENKSELYEFLYARHSLYRKKKRAEKNEM
jgi:hypothetical protein